MQYNASERPRIGTNPRIVSASGRACQAIPNLHARWQAELQLFDVFCWLEVSNNTFRDFHISIDSLDELFRKYAEDPEAVLKEYFSWTPKEYAKSTKISLADLNISFD